MANPHDLGDIAAAELEREAEELTARLEAARQRREAAAEPVSELAALKARVEEEERLARNETAIAEAVRKHGPVGVGIDVIDVPDGRIVIVTRPHPALFKAFQDLEKVTFEETEKLVRPSVVYPDKSAYDTIADIFPGVVSGCGVKVCALAGMRRVELRGK